MADVPSTGSFQAAPAASLVGEVLDGRYRILKLIGEGGMGEVYAAEHIHIEKKYAIKLLRSEIVSNPEAVTRFRQEARSSSSIGHRNIIAIEDFGQLPDGRIYMCMELLNGAPLNDMIKSPMAVDRLLNILIQTGHGLSAAHAKGIVHRDMKPENIFVTIGPSNEDVPKLLDFGIAKVAGNDGQNHLTRTGTIFGTPFYMAPEQALGNPVDARTDIYAVGVIMYEVFAGSLPFQGESFMGILTQHITTEPEAVAARAAKVGRVLPNGLADIVTRCMQKNPAQRFSSMDEVVNALIGVYRGIAGAGMSTYMEAFGASSAASQRSQPALTPPHITGPATGPVYIGAPGSGSGPVPVPGAATNAASASGLYNPASSVVDIPKKSKAGLFIALFAVVAVAGGITAVAVLGKGDGKGKTGGGSAGSSAIIAADPKDVNPKVEPKLDPKSGSAGGNVIAAVADAGVLATPPPTPGDGGLEVATVSPDAAVAGGTKVLLDVKNVSTFQVWENGTKLSDDVDFELEIEPGHPRTLVLKSKGFLDQKVIVDGTKHKVLFNLDHVPGVTPPKLPPKPDCSNKLLDMRDSACRQQFCAHHRHDPQWERKCDIDDE